ncbi:Rnf-Nqr domain containing protein [uncultured Gemmiger sp.]|uniref:Rnf-Nqr domain containing protein n=1 Tax=uncultured Gemmiger sp. TaxID=1623490 RepID=UPI0025FB4242|nr:Rnf-Nqr domain containing protein [uncultured Gemmiger sp.]
MQNEQNRKPSKPAARTGRRKNQPEHSQTVIIPQLSPEVLERARRAAAEGKTPQQIDEEAAAAARQAAQAQSAAEQAVEPKPQPKPQAKARKTRAEAEAELAQSIHDDHLWLNNPVMVRGLGLAPIVAMASDGDRALMLCVLSILLLTATRMLAVAVCHITGNRFRPVVYAYSAAILYIPVYIIMYNIFGTNLSIMGIYLPMMVVEPVIVKRMEAAELETIGEAFRKGINNTIGLCIAILLVGTLRELLAYGTVFEKPLLSVGLLPLAAQPAGGFLLLGLLAAGWTAVGGAYVHYKQEEVRHLYADRKQ